MIEWGGLYSGWALQILSVIFRKVCVCVEGRKEGNEPPTALKPTRRGFSYHE